MGKTLDVMTQNNWAWGGSAGFARYEFSDDFVDEDGRQYEGGSKSYLEVPTTISGSVVTVPAYPDFPTTEAAILNNGVTVTCHLLDSNRVKRTTLFENCRIYESLSSPISLSQLVLANGASRIQRDTDVWTKEQVIDYVGTLPPASKATALAYGVVRLDEPADDPTDPEIIGSNSPTSTNTPNKVVRRDASGNFAAGEVTVEALISSGDVEGDNVIADGEVSGESVSTTDGLNITGADIEVVSEDGMRIGTSPTQKLAFFNGTPVVQQILAATTSGATLLQLEAEVNSIKTLLAAIRLFALPVLPTTVSGLLFWYKASTLTGTHVANDPVASWTDSSGNGLTATQATANLKPTYQTLSGVPVVRFDGGDKLAFTAQNNIRAVFIVGKHDLTGTNGNRYMPLLGHATVFDLAGLEGTRMISGTLAPLLINGSSFMYNQEFEPIIIPKSALQLQAYAFTTSANVRADNIGSDRGAHFLTGDIAEIFAFSAVPTRTEIMNLLHYLRLAYTLTQPKLVVIDGNSLSGDRPNEGSGEVTAANSWPIQMMPILSATAFGNYDTINAAVGGQKYTEMLADAATEVDPLFNEARAKNVLVVWEGTNELGNATTGAAAYAKYAP